MQTPGPIRWSRSNDFRILARDPAGFALARRFLPNPDASFAMGEHVSSGRVGNFTEHARLMLDGQSLFIKRYQVPNAWKKVRSPVRRSKAVRSFFAGHWCREHDIPTPEPLCLLEERKLGFLGRAYVVFPFVPARTLWDRWPTLNGRDRWRIVTELASAFGRMHASGILHGDLNWRNVLLEDGRDDAYSLVDLDGTTRRRVRMTHATEDLRHFLRDLDRMDADLALKDMFLSKWRSAYGGDAVAA